MMEFLIMAIRAGTPFMFASLGEIFNEKSGVLNVGLEGVMLIGALAGFVVNYYSSNLWIGVCGGAIAGMIASSIHGFISISLKAPQIISGMALTIFGGGITAFFGKSFIGVPSVSFEPLVGDFTPLMFIAILAFPISSFVLIKTRFGMKVTATGENPEAADSVGVKVFLIRYICILIGGAMAGIAGAYISLDYSPMWREGIISGRGWISLALVYFSMRKPSIALIGSLLFGALWVLQFRLQGLGFGVSPYLLMMIPYIATILSLSFLSVKKVRVGIPKALGKPYSR